jgi:hypothetical protein
MLSPGLTFAFRMNASCRRLRAPLGFALSHSHSIRTREVVVIHRVARIFLDSHLEDNPGL